MNIQLRKPDELPTRREPESTNSKEVVAVFKSGETILLRYDFWLGAWVKVVEDNSLRVDPDFLWHYPISWNQASDPKREFKESVTTLNDRIIELDSFLRDPLFKALDREGITVTRIDELKAAIELLKGGEGV